jgi:hypothetical protein
MYLDAADGRAAAIILYFGQPSQVILSLGWYARREILEGCMQRAAASPGRDSPKLPAAGANWSCNEFEFVSDSPSLGPSSPFPSLILQLYCVCTVSSRFAFTLDAFSILLYFTKTPSTAR